ncbi:3092_t:CDS:2 [Ambispora leptoticha]|uniref:3092_t:CDS:1 n=1 Tax=Ambispora leptoticha TaxID=144679 RepID=A0A9N8VH53_9GLOM|nr:3092_t:CDS:2 [Ambispora leptoticha]
MVKLAFINPTLSIFCTGLSAAGVIFLVVLGALFDAEVESLTESTHDPDDPHAVASACYLAAVIYAAFLTTCGCQIISLEDALFQSFYGGELHFEIFTFWELEYLKPPGKRIRRKLTYLSYA